MLLVTDGREDSSPKALERPMHLEAWLVQVGATFICSDGKSGMFRKCFYDIRLSFGSGATDP